MGIHPRESIYRRGESIVSRLRKSDTDPLSQEKVLGQVLGTQVVFQLTEEIVPCGVQGKREAGQRSRYRVS